MKSREEEFVRLLRARAKSKMPFSDSRKLLDRAADIIESLEDENTSVWAMIDEIRSSEVENFKHVIESATIESYSRKLLDEYLASNERDKNGKN